MQASLSSRVQSGLVWNSISVASTFLVGLTRSIILARLLTPDDYGLYGMAWTVLAGASALTSTGLDISVISTKFKDEKELYTHLDTIWTMEIIRGCVLALLLLSTAYPVARFYSDERLYSVLLLISLGPLIQGFQNVGLLILRKEVRFRKVAWLELATAIISAASSIVFALWQRNYWALIYGQLVSVMAGAAFSYSLHPFRPRLALNREAARRAFNFGKYVFLISLLNYAMTTTDNILLGRLFGPVVLGTYVIAYGVAALPLHALWVIVANVTWSAYAEISGENRTRLEQAFVRVLAVASTLLAMTTCVLLLFGDGIVTLLYGEKWAAAGTPLRILSVFVFCRGLTLLIMPLVRSLRGMSSDAGIKAFEAVIFFALLYPLARSYGAVGAASAMSIVYLITMVNRVWLVRSLLPGAWAVIMRTLLGAATSVALGAALGATVIYVVQGMLPRLLLGSALVLMVVAISMLLFSAQLRAELSQIYRQAVTPT